MLGFHAQLHAVVLTTGLTVRVNREDLRGRSVIEFNVMQGGRAQVHGVASSA